MTPAQVLVEQLGAARRGGVSFEEAWPSALCSALAVAGIELREWTRALTGMASTWRAAFEILPASAPERAADPDRVQV
jgi:hypothetical protein